ncbi:hypothetical protein [Pontivivens nitratireducens]|uniref:Sulfotransferase family protein n=1 Tax=Pontivivens nitratireducens TaxID=2758038 RepID=A0A6G7VQY7_9RHOB|nr:hypothetical protein [Pontibrevibacter nitratireducens]QIK42332.1 hypothetical protein G8E03_15920 [Pontibrevibacter nitratireducens]
MFSPRQLVLVTGMPRSGTTVIGERLSQGPTVAELYEPMSRKVGDIGIHNQFETVGAGGMSPEQAQAFVARLRRGQLWGRWPGLRSGRNPLLNRTRRTMLAAAFKPGLTHLIWKDPFAVLWADWLTRNTDISVIFTLRAPLSVVASFSRMGWHFDPADLARRMAQSGLLTADLPQRGEGISPNAHDAMLIWYLVHLNLRAWMDADSPITVVDIEDNLEHGVAVGERLQAATGLPVAAAAALSTAPTSGEALPQKAHVKERSAQSITTYWKQTLSPQEIEACEALNGALFEELRARVSLAG